LIRPLNALSAAVAAVLGALISNQLNNWLLAGAATFFAVGFGNISNDILDIDGDRINHPQRALASGRCSVGTAKVLAIVSALLCLVLAAAATKYHLLGAGAALCVLFAYNRFLKQTAFIGNLTVSVLVSFPLVFGSLGTTLPPLVLLMAALATVVNFQREIAKDLADVAGDTAAQVRTTAHAPQEVINTVFYSADLLWALLVGISGYVLLTAQQPVLATVACATAVATHCARFFLLPLPRAVALLSSARAAKLATIQKGELLLGLLIFGYICYSMYN